MNNLIKRYSVFTHGLLEKQVFSFHLYNFSFYLSFRLVRNLVFLFFNVNVYLIEIPCLNKVTIPSYHTLNTWVSCVFFIAVSRSHSGFQDAKTLMLHSGCYRHMGSYFIYDTL